MNEVRREGKILKCTCGAQAKDTAKERGRFLRRHPKLCGGRMEFTRRLATGVRSVEYVPDEPLLKEVEVTSGTRN